MLESIINKINSGKNLFITGPAGTGKSTIVKDLKKHYSKRLIVTSTTGVSALNIGGCTIHSFSGIGIHTDPRAIESIVNQFNWASIRSRVRSAKIIVIDEISMLRLDQLELIDEIFRRCTGKMKPFGDKTIIFVGDFLQLPPVIKRDEKLKFTWVFDSQLWKEAKVETINLYTIYRQEDPEFLKHLMKIRFGICDDPSDLFFKSRVKLEKDVDPNSLRFFSTNVEADNFNQFNLEAIKLDSYHHEAKVDGQSEHYIKQIKSSVIALEHLELKVGCRVMFISNMKEDPSSDEFVWVNGSLGTVVDYKHGNPFVQIDDSGKIVEVCPFTWKMTNWNDEELASFTQIPLKLAYGVTIHKSQGLTLSKAVIDCRRVFADGQGYVALSRVKTAEGLTLLNWNKNLIKADQSAVEFYMDILKKDQQ